MTTAAALSIAGLPAMRYLTTDDPFERVLLTALARRAMTMLDVLSRNQAQHTVNALSKALRR